MPAAEAAASVTRDGEALRFAGALVRDSVPGAWRAALPLVAGARCFDLREVASVDSAGVALLAELAARRGSGAGADAAALRIEGEPAGLAELRAAYRLQVDLSFA